MSKPDLSFASFPNDFEEMLNNYLNLQNELGTKLDRKIEFNLFKSMEFVYIFSILEHYTDNKFWDNKSDKKLTELPTTFATWPRFNEFETAYRIRNCFIHRLGFLDTNKESDNAIIDFKTTNKTESEYYKIDEYNKKTFILLDLKWRQKSNKLITDYINWVSPKGYWLLD